MWKRRFRARHPSKSETSLCHKDVLGAQTTACATLSLCDLHGTLSTFGHLRPNKVLLMGALDTFGYFGMGVSMGYNYKTWYLGDLKKGCPPVYGHWINGKWWWSFDFGIPYSSNKCMWGIKYLVPLVPVHSRNLAAICWQKFQVHLYSAA